MTEAINNMAHQEVQIVTAGSEAESSEMRPEGERGFKILQSLEYQPTGSRPRPIFSRRVGGQMCISELTGGFRGVNQRVSSWWWRGQKAKAISPTMQDGDLDDGPAMVTPVERQEQALRHFTQKNSAQLGNYWACRGRKNWG